ncbi:PH domain-containing protein [Tricladium varicosporioides]|nr:PH domain-containing protein [Hymenoscyphus varicosporioides]
MAAQQSTLPSRSATTASQSSTLSDKDATPGEDAGEVAKLFSGRLQAWKHAVGYLEDYVTATEKMQYMHGKEYEKIFKTVTHPLKEGHYFDQSLGGVVGMFNKISSNTQGISNTHYETAKTLKGSILPIFERLHAEIKNKNKEFMKGVSKGGKLVDKARDSTQKHIELLEQHIAYFDSTGGKVAANEDPYILQRGVMYRLHNQVIEENNNREEMLASQNNVAQFEAHVIHSIQQGMGQFHSTVSKQADLTKSMYGDMVATSQRIPPDFEWNSFVKHNTDFLIDPSALPRSMQNISFRNQNHRATQPLISGSLDRKSKIMHMYDTSYYVVTPSKFLHEFKTDDDFGKDPIPELSLFLPDCIVGGIDGQKFAVKGKDMSKGKFSSTISLSHDYQFKAHTPADAQKWWDVMRSAAGQTKNELPDFNATIGPAAREKAASGDSYQSTLPQEQLQQGKPELEAQTQGITGGENVKSPTEALTASATAGQEEGTAAHDAIGTTCAAPIVSTTSSAAPAPVVEHKPGET